MAPKEIKTQKKGHDLMRDPILNKGTGFSEKERQELGLRGILPPQISTIQEQVERRYYNFCSKKSGIEKYEFLAALQERNETLYFRLIKEHLEEMVPYIYTPTVASAALEFSLLYNQSRGLFISPDDVDRMDEIFNNAQRKDVDVIVVTDGSRVLGIGDVTFGSMTIAIGKSNLYVLFGGIAPDRILPVVLDLGTDNPDLLKDPLYLGRKTPRLQGQAYLKVVDAFVCQVKKRYPKALLQWEDFSTNHAGLLLEIYRNQLCTFNDDIQGTSAVVLGAILSFCRGVNKSVKDVKIVIYGAGSAGTGFASLFVKAAALEGVADAHKSIFLIDRNGLVITDEGELPTHQQPFAKTPRKRRSLLEVIQDEKPDILIGTSSQKNHFTKEIVEAMASNHEKSAIFPLSNPNEKAEANPKDVVSWSQGKILIATGSPFDPYVYEGKMHYFSQCNNLAIFPAMGIAVAMLGVQKITEEMFIAAAKTLAQFSPICEKSDSTELLPRVTSFAKISIEIAKSVAKIADPSMEDAEMDRKIAQGYWHPDYLPVVLE